MNDGPTFIDLFCGAGGFSLGFVKAGFKHVLGVDNWNTACETYQANIGNAVCQDLRIFDGKPFVGKIDVVIGSPPCQTFSSANTKTRECNTELCDEFMRIVNEVKPKVWIMENVPECIDYVQAPFKEVFYAGDFGVLQGRERAFFSNIKLEPDKIGQKYLDTEQSAKLKAFRPEAIHRPYQTVTCRYNSFAKTSAHIQDHDGLRVLNHIEALTIQSFPFYYKLTPTAQREIETLIGNAVPPLLAFKLAQYVKGVLAIPHL